MAPYDDVLSERSSFTQRITGARVHLGRALSTGIRMIEVSCRPLRLARVDDPLWLPMQHSSSGLTLRKDHQTTLQLGAGDYRLEDPIVPDQFQQFRVLAATKVLVSEKLAQARDDHR